MEVERITYTPGGEMVRDTPPECWDCPQDCAECPYDDRTCSGLLEEE